jgi:hypothetical protein
MKKYLAFLIFFFLVISFVKAQNNVGIGTNTPDPSAILDISSNDKGVLIPRLTTPQRLAIPSPSNGLLVFDTDFNCFYFYSSSIFGWSSLCGASGINGATGATGPPGGPPGPTGPTGIVALPVFQYINTGATFSININTDVVIVANGQYTSPTLVLPACSTVGSGKVIIIKRDRVTSTGAANANFFLTTSGSDLVHHNSTATNSLTIYSTSYPDNGVVRLVTDGITWYVW